MQTLAKNIDGISVVQDENDPTVTHFIPVSPVLNTNRTETDNRSWWKRLYNWWNDSPVTPYAKMTDLNNSENSLDENKPKNAAEIGIKIKF